MCERGAVVSLGVYRAHPSAGRRGGRWLSPVELWLPELPGRPRRSRHGHPPHPGKRGRQRRRRVLVPAECLSGDPSPDRELPRSSPARAPALAHRRHRPHQRRPRPHPGSALAPRIPPARRLRHRSCASRLHRGQCSLSDPRAVSRAGDLALSRARTRDAPGRCQWPRERPLHRGRGRAGQASDSPRADGGRRSRGQCRPQDSRGLHGAAARLFSGGGRPHPERAESARRGRLRLLRRDILVERRAARPRPGNQARRGHGTPARGG